VTKPRLYSGMQPSADSLQIGNYIGALMQWRDLQEAYDAFFSVVDLHALTQPNDPAELREKTRRTAAQYIAAGIEPSKSTLYVQSHVPAHAELAWVLSTLTGFGEAGRMTQFKDKSQRYGQDATSVGLFTYPVLMAADILLYDADLVPVGKDQKQHLEIAQEIARKVNNQYGEVLRVPEAKIDEAVMTIPGLDGRKMSKSYDNTIELFGTDKQLTKRVKQITTDSTEYGRPLSTEGDTLFQIHALFATDAESQALAARYASGRKDPSRPDSDFAEPSDNYFGWGDAKKALAECLLDKLGPVRSEYARLMADQAHLQTLLREGATKARRVAREVLHRVEDATGLVRSAEP
jgi:tryptophanyl-tRNA synthetase